MSLYLHLVGLEYASNVDQALRKSYAGRGGELDGAFGHKVNFPQSYAPISTS